MNLEKVQAISAALSRCRGLLPRVSKRRWRSELLPGTFRQPEDISALLTKVDEGARDCFTIHPHRREV